MFPRWLSWLFLLTLGYIFYQASQISAPQKQPAPVDIPTVTQTKYPALAEVTDVERWKRKLNPDYAAVMNCTLDTPKDYTGLPFAVTLSNVGEGIGVACGEEILVQLTVWNSKGMPAYEATLPLALGSRQIASGLDFGLLGIGKGGSRTLVLPPYALVRGKASKTHAAAVKALGSDKIALVTITRIE